MSNDVERLIAAAGNAGVEYQETRRDAEARSATERWPLVEATLALLGASPAAASAAVRAARRLDALPSVRADGVDPISFVKGDLTNDHGGTP